MRNKIFISVVLCMMMVCMTASATTITSEFIETDTNGNQYFTTSGTIDNNANGFVTILVIDGESITVDNIMYIDQTAANASGEFSFTKYSPKINLDQRDEYIVKIGATSLTSAVSGGVLALPEIVDNTSIAGSVALNFTGGTGASLTLKDASGNAVETLDNAKDFCFESLTPGTYTLVATKALHLPASVSVTYSDTPVKNVSIPLYAGDVNGDKNINLTDLSMLLGSYKTNTPSVDLDGSGTVDVVDLTALVTNYGRYVAE